VTPTTLALQYDIRNPPSSTTLHTVTYIGAAVATCGEPVWTYTKSSVNIPFLSTTFNPTTLAMGIVLTTPTSAVKGTYAVDATFTAPGAKVSTTGLTLTVINGCDTTVFPSAPTMTPTGTNYYYGQGDLAVAVQYSLDSKLCGGYSVQITLNTQTS
jgi:hypothetical protein